MGQVTLIGNRIAKEGGTFVFVGPQPACRECRLKSACLSLSRGRVYEILATRDVHHEDACAYHEDGVRVVEVGPARLSASLKTRLAVEGSTTEHVRPVCSNHTCAHYDRCHPEGLTEPTRVRVVATGERLECPLGYDLTAAELEYA